MDKKEIEMLLKLLQEYQSWSYPEPLGTSEESDLNSVISDVEYTLENYDKLVYEGDEAFYAVDTLIGYAKADSFEKLLEIVETLESRGFSVQRITLVVEK
jgi:hypothetical protein